MAEIYNRFHSNILNQINSALAITVMSHFLKIFFLLIDFEIDTKKENKFSLVHKSFFLNFLTCFT